MKNFIFQVNELCSGSRVILGSFYEQGVVLPKQMFKSEKMTAGSGILTVRVVREGPTRVLSVFDIRYVICF